MEQRSSGTRSKPFVSVVIPAFNEEENIPRCLEALTKQDTKEPFEVIIVDNDSTDNTKGVAKTFADRLDLRVIDQKKRGRGGARAAGCAEARGEIIFSTDADGAVPPNWIRAYLECFEKDPSLVAATGVPNIHDLTPIKNTLFNISIPQILRMNYLSFGHPGLSGFSFAIKKSAYDAAGGFDPETDCYEDLELAQRVHKIGKIILVTDPPIIFSGRRFQKSFLKGYLEYVSAFFQMFVLRRKRVFLSDPRVGDKGRK